MKKHTPEYDKQLADAEAKLRAAIVVHLATCCSGKYACVEKTIKEDKGREYVAALVFSMCSTGEGMPIQSALSLIDSDLCSQ